MGESSNVAACSQLIPSSEIAIDSGVRGPLGVPGGVSKLLSINT